MANTDSRGGLKPLRHKSGAPYNGASTPYWKDGSVATAIFIGDCVTKQGGSNTALINAVGAGSFQIQTLPEVRRTTPGDVNTNNERITGVVVGFATTGTDDPRSANVHSPASTEAVVLVADDPDLVFEVQADNAISNAESTLNAILIDAHNGDTNTGLSGTEIDGGSSTSPAADASFQLRILRAVNREDNDPVLIHAKYEVVINVHTEMQAGDTNAIGTLAI